MRLTSLLLSFILCVCMAANGQNLKISTVYDAKVEGGMTFVDMEPSYDGGFYAAGFSHDTFKFDGSIAPHSYSGGIQVVENIFLMKFDEYGSEEWVRMIFSSNANNLEVKYHTMHVDQNGNAHITGEKYKTSKTDSFLFQSSKTKFVGEKDDGFFIAEYSKKGDLVKTTALPIYLRLSSPFFKLNTASDTNDNYYISAAFEHEIEIKNHKFKIPLKGKYTYDPDIVVFKLDDKGKVPWADVYGGFKWEDKIMSMVYDGNDGLLIMSTTGPRMLFYDQTDSISTRWQKGVVVKYNTTNGKREWHTYNEVRNVRGEMAVDKDGNVFMAGLGFQGLIDIDGKKYGTYDQERHVSYIAKYNPSGVLKWIVRHDFEEGPNTHKPYANGYAQINQLKTDVAGNVYATGFFRDSLFLENGKVLYDPENTSFFTSYNSEGKMLAFDTIKHNIPVRSLVVPDTGKVMFDFIYYKNMNLRGEPFGISSGSNYSAAILTYGELCNELELNTFASGSHCLGSSASFKASAASFYPTNFQWYKDGNQLSSGEYLKIDSFSAINAGSYYVKGTNKCGTGKSKPFSLGFSQPTQEINHNRQMCVRMIAWPFQFL